MADSPNEERDSRSPSPRNEQRRSRSRSIARDRSRSRSLPRHISPSRTRGRSRSRSRGRSEIENPGTTLYVTGLSTRVTEKDLEAHFSKEGKVASCVLVLEPRTRESRGFAFITMDSVKDADRCIKYLNQSVLEGRYIKVERSRRKRPRTPTPGHYLGLKNPRDNDRDSRSSRGRHYDRDDSGYRRSPRRDVSPRDHGRRSPRAGRSSRRDRSYSPRGRSPERRYQPLLYCIVLDYCNRVTPSPPPRKAQLRSLIIRPKSRSMSRDRSRSRSLPRPISPSRSRGRLVIALSLWVCYVTITWKPSEIENPGTTLFVTGLSTRVTEKDLEAHFSEEGKVASCVLVVEPQTRESRGYAFVTMDSLEDAERCIKYLNKTVLDGIKITVKKSRRKLPRTPTPGYYLGLNSKDNEKDRDGGWKHDRWSPKRHDSPRDGRESPRDDHSPRGGRSPEQRGLTSPAPGKEQPRSESRPRSRSESRPRSRSRSLTKSISPASRLRAEDEASVWGDLPPIVPDKELEWKPEVLPMRDHHSSRGRKDPRE
ncbi:unnamed protein product [Eruca vesicaria subsp. sativa]|uniref:RRM domain-containing protein n=1 Tax=Eruca vesicaria subsp. sativa TaxID=29727 RepID=A0ABC8IP67_ERUVS|nr:unnamed protein product [Eruca vesicaria subsp. sativa]